MVLSKIDSGELLSNYIVNLNLHPVKTKAYTSGTFNLLAELIASVVTNEKDPSTGTVLGPRILKMALYGFFVSGPLSHYLVDALQRAFKGRTGPVAQLLQILMSNLILAPIQNTVYLIFMGIFAGARTPEELYNYYRTMFLPVMKSTWIVSPVILFYAQKNIPKFAWSPFFSFCSFILSTYNNIRIKRRRQAARRLKDE